MDFHARALQWIEFQTGILLAAMQSFGHGSGLFLAVLQYIGQSARVIQAKVLQSIGFLAGFLLADLQYIGIHARGLYNALPYSDLPIWMVLVITLGYIFCINLIFAISALLVGAHYGFVREERAIDKVNSEDLADQHGAGERAAFLDGNANLAGVVHHLRSTVVETAVQKGRANVAGAFLAGCHAFLPNATRKLVDPVRNTATACATRINYACMYVGDVVVFHILRRKAPAPAPAATANDTPEEEVSADSASDTDTNTTDNSAIASSASSADHDSSPVEERAPSPSSARKAREKADFWAYTLFTIYPNSP